MAGWRWTAEKIEEAVKIALETGSYAAATARTGVPAPLISSHFRPWVLREFCAATETLFSLASDAPWEDFSAAMNGWTKVAWRVVSLKKRYPHLWAMTQTVMLDHTNKLRS